MPTRKRRVGFIPRSAVLELINQLSFESNLSNSKIINILVEEALYKRGLFNTETGKIKNFPEKDYLGKGNNRIIGNFANEFSQVNNNLIDSEIYKKFLMFLQFQEEMKKNDFN